MPVGILTSSRCSILDLITRIPILYTCSLSYHCQPGGAADLPDCPEQPGIASLVSLTGLQCCSLSFLFSRRTFPDCVCLDMTKYELAAIQPSHFSWQMERCSPGPPAVQPLSIFASSHEPTSLNSVCKCILIVQTTWASWWTTCKALPVFWLK